MGRGKIEIKRIENLKNRRTTYVKRKNGIIKKAEQITKLCEAQACLVMFGPGGKFDDFCSSDNLAAFLDKYQKTKDKPILWDDKHQNLNQEIENIKQENDSMKIQLRHLNGDDISSMHHTELDSLEKILANGLHIVRNKRIECYEMQENSIKIKEEEFRTLSLRLQEQEMAMDENKRQKMEIPYDQQHEQSMKDYNIDYSPMPFAFPILQHIK